MTEPLGYNTLVSRKGFGNRMRNRIKLMRKRIHSRKAKEPLQFCLQLCFSGSLKKLPELYCAHMY